MLKKLLPLMLILAATLACVRSPQRSAPQFVVDQNRFAGGMPEQAVLSEGETTGTIIVDPVKIEPEKTVGYQNVPTTVTAIYDRPPHKLSLAGVVVETLANNRQIKVQDYTLRIAEFEVPVSKSIYDLFIQADGSYTRIEEQQTATGLGGIPVNEARTWMGNVMLSQLLPTGGALQLAYNAVRNSFVTPVFQFGPGFLASTPAEREIWQNQVTLSLNQPLLRGFGPYYTNAGIRIAQIEQRGVAADFEAAVHAQLSQTLQTYWGLIGAIENYKVLIIAYAAALDLLRINRAKFEAGVVPHTDVLQAEAAAEARRDLLIRQRQTVRNLEDQLKRSLFLREGTPAWEEQIQPTEPIAWREGRVNEEAAIEVALAHRPEMRRSESNIERAQVGERVARNDLLPQLNAFGSVTPNGLEDSYGDSVDTLSDGKYISYSAGLQFSYPLQNRAARYRLRQARARQAQTEEQHRDIKDQIALEVRQAVRDLRTARERIDVTQAQVRFEEAKVDAERRRYEVGISTAYQVLLFQEDQATAQVEHVRAVTEYNQASVRLEQSRGTLLKSAGVSVQGVDLRPEVKPVLFPVGWN